MYLLLPAMTNVYRISSNISQPFLSIALCSCRLLIAVVVFYFQRNSHNKSVSLNLSAGQIYL